MKMVLWAVAIIAVVVLVGFMRKIISKTALEEKYRKVVTFAIRALVIAVGMEVLVINFDFFRMPASGYTEQTLNIEDATLSNFDKSTNTSTSDSGYIEFTDLNTRIHTIKLRTNTLEDATIYFDISDDTNASYRYNIAKMEVKAGRHYTTIMVNMSGDVHDLKIKYSTEEAVISISQITINSVVPMNFRIDRVFIMIMAAMAFYVLCMSEYNRKKISENKIVFRAAINAITCVFVLAAIIITVKEKDSTIKEDFSLTYGNQITKELVDAFSAGQLELLDPVGDDLLALDNPYDWSERIDAEISYKWDHLLFEGKYYSYYGIAPVILLFLPYHALTGYYFPSSWAVLLFGVIGIIFLSKFFRCLVEKFFPNLSTNIAYGSLVILQFVTAIWFCFNVTNFYEIAQTSGFACVTCGAYFLLKSGVIGPDKLSKSRLALSGVFLSLGVLCRPTLVLYCFIAVAFIIVGMKKEKNVKYFLAAFLPYIIIGGVQMLYNYARFHSIFDFGIQYSLTINDFTRAEFHPELAFIGYFNYFFAMPRITDVFPYIDTSTVLRFAPQGYYFVATRSAVGIFVKALPAFSYLYGIKAYKRSNNPEKKTYTVLIALACIIVPLIIIFSIWESGYAARYAADFAWEFLIGALIIAYIMYNGASENNKRRLDVLMAVSTMVCILLSVVQIYNWILIS